MSSESYEHIKLDDPNVSIVWTLLFIWVAILIHSNRKNKWAMGLSWCWISRVSGWVSLLIYIDLCWIVCFPCSSDWSIDVCISVNIEVLLNSSTGILVAMQNAGIQHVLGDIIVSDSDPLLLVWHVFFHGSFIICFFLRSELRFSYHLRWLSIWD